ncbi:hypothetical protein B0H17DRAFT_1139436 [Mycena rosella]|uniref:Uncharacterized protein n=1 Tax=Mycena rosella TaxID=1033263 RepID=A0AAD7D452_MYCRO|nr:hypothetical protein B0H17DRAFT_1139436 [Mycena rosella]
MLDYHPQLRLGAPSGTVIIIRHPARVNIWAFSLRRLRLNSMHASDTLASNEAFVVLETTHGLNQALTNCPRKFDILASNEAFILLETAGELPTTTLAIWVATTVWDKSVAPPIPLVPDLLTSRTQF